MDDKKTKRFWLIVVGLIVLAGIAWQFYADRRGTDPFEGEIHVVQSQEEAQDDLDLPCGSESESVNQPQETKHAASATEEPIQFPVYLVGAIQRPGIYQISNSTCLYELIDEAGGFTDDAAAEQINLAARLSANQLIRIPTLAEWQDAPDAFYFKEDLRPIGSDTEGKADEPAGQLININTAESVELERLPGIGPATAKSIISYRESHGPFGTIEEIMNVSGIKSSRFEAIRELITV